MILRVKNPRDVPEFVGDLSSLVAALANNFTLKDLTYEELWDLDLHRDRVDKARGRAATFLGNLLGVLKSSNSTLESFGCDFGGLVGPWEVKYGIAAYLYLYRVAHKVARNPRTSLEQFVRTLLDFFNPQTLGSAP